MIYLDYQATTPLAPEAREAMLPWLDKFGNPHSPHRIGREAGAAIEGMPWCSAYHTRVKPSSSPSRAKLTMFCSA